MGLLTLLLSVASTSVAAAEPPDRPTTPTVAASAAAASTVTASTGVKAEAGIAVTIDSLSPATLKPGTRVQVSGTVSNDDDSVWFDAQVYLSISSDPATTKDVLASFASKSQEMINGRITTYGLFDEIGSLAPGEEKPYSLSVPYSALDISGAPGVYHVGVSTLAREAGEIRDLEADARADTVMPLPPSNTPASQSTQIVPLIPITAPVARLTTGEFIDDRLAASLSYGGRLRNLLDFVAQAPGGSLDLAVDPALLSAVRDMSRGYVVRTLTEIAADEAGHTGQGQRAAEDWLADFDAVTSTQSFSLLPFGNPDTNEFAKSSFPGVVDVAVLASRRFALERGLTGTVLDWQNNGASTRRALNASRTAGATLHLVSQDTLTRLPPEDVNGYPPPVVSVATKSGPLTTLVSRADVGGTQFTQSLTALDVRQRILAEATVRAVSSTDEPTSIIAAPFRWNPGVDAASTDMTPIGASPTLSFGSLLEISQRPPIRYSGPIQVTTDYPAFSDKLTRAIERLRSTGLTYVDLLSDGKEASLVFDRQLAMAGASSWRWQPRRGAALIRLSIRPMSESIAEVTVTGPEFVTLSGDAGRFPLTVTNGLDVPVAFTLDIIPLNPALRIEPVDPILLTAGQRLDIEVVSRADASGLTPVRARLTTAGNRRFGAPWDFDIRATKIGLAIWIFMGVLGALLFSSAAVRIVKRARAGGFKPRGETAT